MTTEPSVSWSAVFAVVLMVAGLLVGAVALGMSWWLLLGYGGVLEAAGLGFVLLSWRE